MKHQIDCSIQPLKEVNVYEQQGTTQNFNVIPWDIVVSLEETKI